MNYIQSPRQHPQYDSSQYTTYITDCAPSNLWSHRLTLVPPLWNTDYHIQLYVWLSSILLLYSLTSQYSRAEWCSFLQASSHLLTKMLTIRLHKWEVHQQHHRRRRLTNPRYQAFTGRASSSLPQDFSQPVFSVVEPARETFWSITVCLFMKTAYRSSFQVSGTPGKHQWLQSCLCRGTGPEGLRYTERWPSFRCAVICVTFNIANPGSLGLMLLPRKLCTGWSMSAHCSSDLTGVASGRVSKWQLPPLLQSPPLRKTWITLVKDRSTYSCI